MTQWVQHKSRQGEKWMVVGDHEHSQRFCWVVWNNDDKVTRNTFHLPCKEYVLVDPPEVWTNVSAECEAFEDDGFNGLTHAGVSRFQTTKWSHDGYRLRKASLWQPGEGGQGTCRVWAFIVEKRQP